METVGADARPEYYRQSAATVVEALGSHKMGLTNAAAARRHTANGANALPSLRYPLWPMLWLRAAVHPLTAGLLLTMFLAVATDQTGLAIVCIGVLIIDVTARFFITRSPSTLTLPELSEHIRVVRNGQIVRVETAKLVPGDIALLAVGDSVPADMRLLSSEGLVMDELALFGRDKPAEKITRSIRGEVPLSERANLLWAGTTVTNGSGAAIVTAIGAQTELGRIIVLANTVLSGQRPAWHWSKLWLVAALLFSCLFLLGWTAGVDNAALLSAALVLSLSFLPIGSYGAYLLALLRLRPRSSTRLATLAQLGSVDTLLIAEPSVARFKLFGLRILHVGKSKAAGSVRALSDAQLAQQIQAGSAAFGELAPEEKLRLVIAAQAAGHRVAVVATGASDLPALIQADAGVGMHDHLAAEFAAARSARSLITRIRRLMFGWTAAPALLMVLSTLSFWFIHIPLILGPAMLLIYAAAYTVLLASWPLRSKTASPPEIGARAAAVTILAYAAFLMTFGLHDTNPTYIDPSHPLVLEASTAALAILLLCALVDSAVAHKKITPSTIGVGAGLLLVLYSPGLQPVIATTGLGAMNWLLIMVAAALYTGLITLQHHSRQHTRAAVIALHHKTYGKASSTKI